MVHVLFYAVSVCLSMFLSVHAIKIKLMQNKKNNCLYYPDVHAQTQWSRWTDCDKACDTGFQNRARECPSGDSSCTVIETRKCHEFSCNMTSKTLVFFINLDSKFNSQKNFSVNFNVLLFGINSDVLFFLKDGFSPDPSVDDPSPKLACWPHNPVW